MCSKCGRFVSNSHKCEVQKALIVSTPHKNSPLNMGNIVISTIKTRSKTSSNNKPMRRIVPGGIFGQLRLGDGGVKKPPVMSMAKQNNLLKRLAKRFSKNK